MGFPRIAIAAALVFSGAPACSQSRVIDHDKLTTEVAAMIKARLPDAEVTVKSPLTIQTKVAGNTDSIQTNLDRLAEFCENNPADACTAMKEDFVASAADLAKPSEVTRDSLRLIVRPKDYVEYVASLMAQAEKPSTIVKLSVADDLTAVLMADFARTAATVDTDDLARLSITSDDAIALGRRQLIASLPKLPTAESVQSKLVAVAEVDYAASIILSPDIDAPATAVGPGFFVAVPDDQFALFGFVTDQKSLARIRKLVADDFRKAQRGISPHLYRRVEGRWVRAN